MPGGLPSGGLNTALSKLDDRSRRIIEARWLREDESTSTLQELADEYGVSAERIRQIESKAMKTIRVQMTQMTPPLMTQSRMAQAS